MGAKIPSVRSDKAARLRRHAVALQKGQVIAIGDETDILAVVLGGHRQAGQPRFRPGLLLGEVSHGKHRMGQLPLAQMIEHIGLVAGGAFRHTQAADAVIAGFHPCVMPTGNKGTAQLIRFLRQQPEFYRRVA